MTDRPAPSLRVLYPGSFDPIHLGHVDVIEQAVELFGEVVVAVMHNPVEAVGLFTVDATRRTRSGVARPSRPSTARHGRVALGARGPGGREAERADFIVKGLRTAGDFEIEQQMAHNNYAVTGIRTVYLPCTPELRYISSRFVARSRSTVETIGHLVPAPVAARCSSSSIQPTTGPSRRP